MFIVPATFILIVTQISSFAIPSGYEYVKPSGGVASYRRKYTANSTDKSPFLLNPPVTRPEASEAIETKHEYNTIYSTIANFVFMFLYFIPQLIACTCGKVPRNPQTHLLSVIFFNTALNMLSLQDFFLTQKLRSFFLFSFL